MVLQHRLSRAGDSVATAAAGFGTTFWWVLAVTAVATAPTLLWRHPERHTPALVGEAVPAEVPMEAS